MAPASAPLRKLEPGAISVWNANTGGSFEWVGRAISPYPGFLVAVFMFTGWDGTLYVNEEVTNRYRGPAGLRRLRRPPSARGRWPGPVQCRQP